MTAPDKPGLSNEEFIKRQRIEIDLNLGLDISYRREFVEALDRLEALIGQGQAERDYTPEEAQLEVTKRFGQGSSVQVDFEVNSDWTWTKRVTLFDWESNEISEAETFREAFANADKAEAERKDKG